MGEIGCTECGANHATEACPVAEMIAQRRAWAERARAAPKLAPAGPSILAAVEACASIAAASDEAIAAMDARLKRDSRAERLVRSGVTEPGPLPDEDRRMIVADACGQTPAMVAVQRWLPRALAKVDPDRNMLILAGPRGTGKTVAAAWAIARTGGRYVTLEEYLRDYSRWQRDRGREDGTGRELQRYDAGGLLVIDELRGELDRWLAEAERPGWHRIVDRRQSRKRHLTIGITNLSRDQFIADLQNGALDPRTYDRMRRSAYIIGVKGESLRKGTL